MKKDVLFKSVRALTFSSLLAAMSVVIGIFCKSFMNFGDGMFRISFEGLPIILSGMIFGPIAGAAVGIASDLISYLLSPQIYPINLVVTVGAGVIGLVSGLVSKLVIKKRGNLQIITATASAHLIGSLIIKSIGLFDYYGWGILLRIPTYILIATIEALIICMLYKNSGFKKLVEAIGKENI